MGIPILTGVGIKTPYNGDSLLTGVESGEPYNGMLLLDSTKPHLLTCSAETLHNSVQGVGTQISTQYKE